jgi:hypothetical protein
MASEICAAMRCQKLSRAGRSRLGAADVSVVMKPTYVIVKLGEVNLFVYTT